MSRSPEIAAMVDTLAEALGSGCPKGCMRNAVMCRTFSPDFVVGEDLNAALRRARVDPCRCWCHAIKFQIRPGVRL